MNSNFLVFEEEAERTAKKNVEGTLFYYDDIVQELSKIISVHSLLKLKTTCRHFYVLYKPNSLFWPQLASSLGVIIEKNDKDAKGVSQIYQQFTDIRWDKALHYKTAGVTGQNRFSYFGGQDCWHVYLLSPSYIKNSLNFEKKTCDEKDCTKDCLWNCLSPGCGYSGCSRNQNRHALIHSGHFQGHYISSYSIASNNWCYGCNRWVDGLQGLLEKSY